MLVVETIAKIRRLFFHHKKPIKAISRELKISRRAVRKAIRLEATEFRYERSVQPMPKLGAWREQLDGLLAANEVKPARERLTLMRVFETLRDLVLMAATMRYGATPRAGVKRAERLRPRLISR
jgi:hypothetical protein